MFAREQSGGWLVRHHQRLTQLSLRCTNTRLSLSCTPTPSGLLLNTVLHLYHGINCIPNTSIHLLTFYTKHIYPFPTFYTLLVHLLLLIKPTRTPKRLYLHSFTSISDMMHTIPAPQLTPKTFTITSSPQQTPLYTTHTSTTVNTFSLTSNLYHYNNTTTNTTVYYHILKYIFFISPH